MTTEQSQVIVFIFVMEESDPYHPCIATNIPEQFLKRFLRKLCYDVCYAGNIRVRQGDEIAFELEAGTEPE